MRLRDLVFSEISRRKMSFLLGIAAIAVATGVLVGAIASLQAHDARTEAILLAKERETREKMGQMRADIEKAMEHLGFNMIILPAGQETSNWLADNYAAKTMPAQDARKLEQFDIPAISDILPVLRQKIEWQETGWSVILAGQGAVEGSAPISPGQVRLGHEIHKSLDLDEGATVDVKGESFKVAECLGEEGTKADVTIWLNLADLQELTGNSGRINEIRVREYRGGWKELAAAKERIREILPGTQIVEHNFPASAKIMAFEKARERSLAAIANDRRHRAESRTTLKKFSTLITSAAMLICIVWVALLAARNVNGRMRELALLRSVGLGVRQIMLLFSGRLLILALVGGLLGYLIGGLATPAHWPPQFQLLGLSVATAVVLTFGASIWPILQGARRDPAATFQEAE